MRSFTRFAALAVAVFVLAGCAKPLEVSRVTDIRSKTSSNDIDVLSVKRAQTGSGVPEYAGNQLAEVRAYERIDGKGDVEMAGVSCHLSTPHYEADLVTPAKVRVPLYRGKSSELAVSCKRQGYISRLVTVRAIDVTRAQRLNSGANSGLLGLAVVAVIDAASDNTKNDWKYPPVKVLLERVPNRS